MDRIRLAGGNPTLYGYVGDPNIWVDSFGLSRETGLNSKILTMNLARERMLVGVGQTAAHIVASTGKMRQWAPAVESRAILEKYRININDAANGIPLGHPTPHNITHIGSFHVEVLKNLQDVESKMIKSGYGAKAIRSALRKELRSIGKEVLKKCN